MMVRPIPKRLLRETIAVRMPDAEGGYGDALTIEHVRFDRVQGMCADEHRSADAGAGTIYIDAMNSRGAFEVPAGSRVDIDGASLAVAKCTRFCGLGGTIHHWELEVR